MTNQTNKIKGSNILITGGAGFIGSYLTENLLEFEPNKIFIIDNLFRGTMENMKNFINNPKVEFIEGDIRDNNQIDKLMSQSDFCFHMAALRINACAANPQDGFDVMVKSTFDIIENAKKNNIKKLIYSSSASIYGLAQHFPTPESDNPYDNQTFYGAAKMFGEQILRSYYHMYGLNYVALRYFNVYGPRMDTDGKYTEVMIRWLKCIQSNTPPLIYGDGSTSMDFVYVNDVARANVLALLSDSTNEVFNIGNNRETSLKQLLEILLKVNNSNLIPEYKEDNTVNPVKRRLADIQKAKNILNFEPTIKLEEGLKLLSDWFFNKQ